MTSLALMLKSFSGDFDYAKRLVASFIEHNPTGLQLYCVVPAEDVLLFSELASSHVTVIDESPFENYFTIDSLHGIRPGYINQEIVKLAFWELGLAENYFCIDSDAVIIRDITAEDFIAADCFPYSVLIEDKELKVEPRYYREYWRSRETSVARIAHEVGLDGRVLRTCHGHQVFSSTVLKSFKEDFLAARGWSYLDALEIAPYEFTWYNMWLQKSGAIPIHAREPFVKVFHHEGQHLEYILRGIGTDDIARGYLAIVINSNYSRDLGLVSLDSDKARALAPYLSYREAAALIRTKIRESVRRRTSS
ncbi:MAG: DUF6492 family protein [Candidatus Nanopelagicales bacterium]